MFDSKLTLILIHPDLCCALGILGEYVARAARKGVGVFLAEDVTHPRTGDNLELAATLPHAKRNLQILPTPHVHLHVVLAQLNEPRLFLTPTMVNIEVKLTAA